ncbi:hypothetical protein, partial [Enterobacter kobei]|uniref:hypothetical protein n=1 Tax=Enterobacter kobei TaxID=208224 RepID=UPI0013D6BA6F
AHVVSNVAWNGSSGRVRLFNRATQTFVPLGMPRYISPLRAGQVATADVALVSIPDEVLVDEMKILDFNQPISRLAGVRTGADI